jgi:glycosyltransferase involved in cell wall biosynthesis
MRIAMISPLYESVPPKLYGGTERVINHLAQGLKAQGHDVTVFASGDSTVDARLIPMIDKAFRLRKNPVRDIHAYDLKMLAEVAKRADEFDVIHNHHDYWMLPLSEMTETPVVTTLHGRMDLTDIPAAFFSYPKAHFVSISDSQRGPMGLLPWVRTIHHGIDASDFEFHPEPGKYLAFLGRFSVDKRPDLAIEIAKKSGIPLKLAAKMDPECQDYFDEMVKPHIDGKFIEYVGEISEGEKSKFLGEAYALAFPIDWPEPFGLVMIESLACGTPVLARPCGAAPEVLKDGVTGYCHKDVNELARRVRDISSLDRRQCRAWVEEHFSLKRMTEDYIDVYRELSQTVEYRGVTDHRRDFLYSV